MTQQDGWKLDRTINLPTIITALVLLGGLVVSYTQIQNHFQRHDDQIQQLQEQMPNINKRFDKIDDKLDVIIQRQKK